MARMSFKATSFFLSVDSPLFSAVKGSAYFTINGRMN